MAGHERAAPDPLATAHELAAGEGPQPHAGPLPGAGERTASAPERREAGGERALDLIARLQEEPYRFDFFQLLRRMECAYRDRARIGRSQRPGEDPIRLGTDPALTFAPSAISSFALGKNGHPPRLGVRFFGAFGPNAPLPIHLTEFAHQRMRNNSDPTFARFVDVFHHRMLAMFYRAWADARPVVAHDRPEADRFVTYVGALLGIGTPALRGRDEIPDEMKLFFAGRFGQQSRNAEGLRAMIGDFFQMPVAIEEFVGEWVSVSEQHCWRLGARPRRRARPMGVLGQSALIGKRVWERQHKFRVVLGPLRRDQFDSMLPSGRCLSKLSALVRNYVGDEFRWDVKLTLQREAVAPVRLGQVGQLGRTSFLVRGLMPKAWDDVIVDPALQRPAEPRAQAAE